MRFLLVGADGLVGSALRPELAGRGHLVDGGDLPSCNLTVPATLEACAGDARPDWIVNLAAWTDVDGCEGDPAKADLVNGQGAGNAARLAAARGARLLQVSTDYVFDGTKRVPLTEEDPPAPLSAYGRSKLAGERAAAAVLPADRLLVVRGQSLYGAGRKSFPDAILAAAAVKTAVPVVTDQVVSPTWSADFARGLADLIEAGAHGLVHLSAVGSCSWNEFAREVLAAAGMDPARITATTAAALGRPAPRPAYSVFDLARFRARTGKYPRPWKDQVHGYLASTGEGALKGFLVTGGSGFIGSNLVRMLLERFPGEEVWNLDLLTYAGSGNNLADLEGHPRYRFVKGDVADIAGAVRGGFRAAFHLAAESHVDRSTIEAVDFVRTNVQGTQSVVDWARTGGAARLVHVSTDEVYGSLGATGRFRETTPLSPNSPYAASKASSDLLVLAAVRTHGLDAVVTRCSNNYGPWQFPEKLIPLMLTNALDGEPLPVYGDGLQVRDWIHVEDHGRGLLAAFEKGRAGEVYNFGGSAERENLAVVKGILAATGRGEDLLRFVEDRPGHDRRYAIDARKARRELGWSPARRFERGLRETVAWYRANEAWWRAIKSSGGFRAYYGAMYGKRLREAAP